MKLVKPLENVSARANNELIKLLRVAVPVILGLFFYFTIVWITNDLSESLGRSLAYVADIVLAGLVAALFFGFRILMNRLARHSWRTPLKPIIEDYFGIDIDGPKRDLPYNAEEVLNFLTPMTKSAEFSTFSIFRSMELKGLVYSPTSDPVSHEEEQALRESQMFSPWILPIFDTEAKGAQFGMPSEWYPGLTSVNDLVNARDSYITSQETLEMMEVLSPYTGKTCAFPVNPFEPIYYLLKFFGLRQLNYGPTYSVE
ncbi:hypothetical protein BSR29_00890 [Boudabousia liubingyangii]|uniref:Uncharacterized protein n=1 Tax=Boudabousia liubingyangii TaxID=1921764 RepID=A0A1Q5PQ63_9ACTO|nr:hypothetical protein [Boudabousia liubingyangii]OKL49545.1 hypothetical protein BSR29_00890 [Boudabousia liubingyangii]